MNDRLPFPHYFDKSGALRVFRKQQPSSSARLEHWASALRDAHDNRAHAVKIVCKRDEHGKPIGIPERIKRPEIDFKTLLAKIERQLDGEKKRGGQQEAVLSAVMHAFGGQGASAASSMRNHILDLAIVGQITPEEAETWARRLGVRQIAKQTGHDLCDPMREAGWSILMAAIWMQWRDLRLVARVSPDSKNFLPLWVEIEHEDGSKGYDLDPVDDLEDVKRELASYLRSAVSLASGFQDGERREIAPVEWADLQIVGSLESEGFANVMSPLGERDIYARVRLSRDDLLAAFPPTTCGAEDLKAKYSPKGSGPGRPTAIHMVTEEAKCRRDAGAALDRIGAEAKYLHQWCKENHRDIAPPSANTIEKAICADYNEWKSAIPHN